MHDPYNPSSDDDNLDDNSSDSDSEDLGIHGANDTNGVNGSGTKRNGDQDGEGDGESKQEEKHREVANKKSERRRGRGLMQWKPVRVSAED